MKRRPLRILALVVLLAACNRAVAPPSPTPLAAVRLTPSATSVPTSPPTRAVPTSTPVPSPTSTPFVPPSPTPVVEPPSTTPAPSLGLDGLVVSESDIALHLDALAAI